MDWIKLREGRKTGLFSTPKDQYNANIQASVESLQAYADGQKIAMTYSGGKDSSATLSFVLWCIEAGHIEVDDLIVLYADTGLELPPLAIAAERTLEEVSERGYKTKTVKAPVESRLYVKMLGYGYPYPTNRRRWCTRLLKQEPMNAAIAALDGDWQIITGVRLGESKQRDDIIQTSCSVGDGECGQGWYQQQRNALAPIVHWRACHVFRWIFNDARNSLPSIKGIEDVYKLDEFVPDGIRTGCIKCQVVHEDKSFKYLVDKVPEWSWLAPLHDLDQLHAWLAEPAQRLRKVEQSAKADGTLREGGQRLGAIAIEARREGLRRLLEIQNRTNAKAPQGMSISLVDEDERQAIEQMWRDNIHPRGWTGDEPRGDELFDRRFVIGKNKDQITQVQPLLPIF